MTPLWVYAIYNLILFLGTLVAIWWYKRQFPNDRNN